MDVTREQLRKAQTELRKRMRLTTKIVQEIAAYLNDRSRQLQDANSASPEIARALRTQDFEAYFATRMASEFASDSVFSPVKNQFLNKAAVGSPVRWQVQVGDDDVVVVMTANDKTLFALFLLGDAKKLYVAMKGMPTKVADIDSKNPLKESTPLRTQAEEDETVMRETVGVYLPRASEDFKNDLMQNFSNREFEPYESENFLHDAVLVMHGVIAGAISYGGSHAERQAAKLIAEGTVSQSSFSYGGAGATVVYDFSIGTAFNKALADTFKGPKSTPERIIRPA